MSPASALRALESTSRGRWLLTTGAGYLYMATVLATTAFVTPAAVRHLGTQEYGLWAIASQLLTYVTLLDFGLARSMQRLVAEALVADSAAGARRYTLLWVFSALMAVVLFLTGCLLCHFGLRLLAVPASLIGVGTHLFLGLLALSCLGYLFAPLGGVLYAQNRVYFSTAIYIASAWVNAFAFLYFLHRGCGVLSYLYASMVNYPIGIVGGILLVLFGPAAPRFDFTLPRWLDFREVFGFSGWLFLNGLLSQFQMTFPMLLVTRFAGLASAGRFYLSLRLAGFLYQLICQFADGISPRWQDMYLTGRLARLGREFSEGLLLLSQLAVVGATCFAAGLKPLLLLWMGPVMYDGPMLTTAFCAFIVINIFASYLPKPLIWDKAYPGICAAIVIEVAVGLPLSLWVLHRFGVGAMLLTAMSATAVITIGYYLSQGPRRLEVATFLFTWSRRDLSILLVQTAGLAAALAMIWLLERAGASWLLTFNAGLAMSAAAILYFLGSEWPRLREISQWRRAAPGPPA